MFAGTSWAAATLAGGALILAWAGWRYKFFPRLVAICMAIAAGGTLVAFPLLLAAFAATAGSSSAGLTVLAYVDLITGAVFVCEVLFGRRHHAVHSMMAAAVLAAALAVTWAVWPHESRHLATVVPQGISGAAMAIRHVRSADSLRHPMPARQRWEWIGGFAAVLFVLWRMFLASHKRSPARRIKQVPLDQIAGSARKNVAGWRDLAGRSGGAGRQGPPVTGGPQPVPIDGRSSSSNGRR